MSNKLRHGHLVHGYIRQSPLTSSQLFPTELISLCISFSYVVSPQFVLYEKKKNIFVNEEGTQLTTFGYGLGATYFFPSVGYEMQSGVHIWSVKCIKRNTYGYYAVAMTTKNNPKYIGRYIWSNMTDTTGDRYIYRGRKGIIYGLLQNGQYLFENKEVEQFDEGDIITTKIDCNQWTLQFFKNLKSVCDKITVRPNKYYPAIQLSEFDNNFKVIDIDATKLDECYRKFKTPIDYKDRPRPRKRRSSAF